MKITFPVPHDSQVHTYCLRCLQESITTRTLCGRVVNVCGNCRHTDARALIIDPAVNWWLAKDSEYWHETAGVFVLNDRSEMLFFDRTRYPFGLTPPAGHVDQDERPAVAARRELREETAISLPASRFSRVVTADIIGDGCRRGSDAHRWHAFRVSVSGRVKVKVDKSEGSQPVWLTLDQALASQNLTFATRYMLENYGDAIVTS